MSERAVTRNQLQLTSRNIDPKQGSSVRQNVPAHSFERTAAMLRSSSIDHWQVVIMRRGQSWTEIDGRVAVNRPGEVQVGSLGNRFSGRATSSESLILYLPRDLFTQATHSAKQVPLTKPT